MDKLVSTVCIKKNKIKKKIGPDWDVRANVSLMATLGVVLESLTKSQ